MMVIWWLNRRQTADVTTRLENMQKDRAWKPFETLTAKALHVLQLQPSHYFAHGWLLLLLPLPIFLLCLLCHERWLSGCTHNIIINNSSSHSTHPHLCSCVIENNNNNNSSNFHVLLINEIPQLLMSDEMTRTRWGQELNDATRSHEESVFHTLTVANFQPTSIHLLNKYYTQNTFPRSLVLLLPSSALHWTSWAVRIIISHLPPPIHCRIWQINCTQRYPLRELTDCCGVKYEIISLITGSTGRITAALNSRVIVIIIIISITQASRSRACCSMAWMGGELHSNNNHTLCALFVCSQR